MTWIALLLLSLAFGGILLWLHLPAALLLGPMLAAIAIGAARGGINAPQPAFLLAQGFIGCMIAKMIPLSIVDEIGLHWPLFIIGVLSVILASGLLGWLLVRMRVLPGTAVLWGSSPGAATVMTLMAEGYGADTRLVAFMQYLRVVLVAVIAAGVARTVGANAPHAAMPTTDWLAPVHLWPLAQTVVLAVLGPVFGRLLRIPAGPLLIPLALGIVLGHLGWITIELPPLLLALSYAFIGWGIGLRFTRPLLRHVAHALPRVLACTLALVVVCCGLAYGFVVFAGIDPLTAYLATSPGGADSVAIIAASTHVDVPFVMAMQTARFIAVLFIGPAMNRFIADRLGPLSIDAA